MNSLVNVHDSIMSLHLRLNLMDKQKIGDYKYSARTHDFSGWLVCDGRALDTEEFSPLYNIIGTSFGSSGSNLFNLPDCRGKVVGASDSIHPIGLDVGSEQCVLTEGQLPAHAHTGVVDADGGHSHTTNATGGTLGLMSADGSNTAIETDSSPIEPNVYTAPVALAVNNAGVHTHTFTTNVTGSNVPINIMQPTLYAGNMFIYSGVSVVPAV
jgi:microcystin-dependent protein